MKIKKNPIIQSKYGPLGFQVKSKANSKYFERAAVRVKNAAKKRFFKSKPNPIPKIFRMPENTRQKLRLIRVLNTKF